jgi:hypothetical protein
MIMTTIYRIELPQIKYEIWFIRLKRTLSYEEIVQYLVENYDRTFANISA